MSYQKDNVHPGVLNQFKAATIADYSKLTAEALEDYLFELMTKEQTKGLSPYGYIGCGLYHIGGGCCTGKKGFDMFEKELKKSIKSYGK